MAEIQSIKKEEKPKSIELNRTKNSVIRDLNIKVKELEEENEELKDAIEKIRKKRNINLVQFFGSDEGLWNQQLAQVIKEQIRKIGVQGLFLKIQK